MTTPAISAHSVRKAFDSVVAVDDVSFAVAPGEIFGLLGPNGAGKTTLIRMIMDILRPDRGRIDVFGHPLSGRDKDRIGYLPEERGLYTRQRVLPVLQYFAQLKGMDNRQARRNALFWLDRLGMMDVQDRKINELSKGNQQKIQFVATLVADPAILILDEPFSGLDPVGTRLLSTILREEAAAGKTVLLSTHQMNLVETLCERVFMIHRGRTVLYGLLSEIRDRYSDNAVLVRAEGDLSHCELVLRAVAENDAVKVTLRPDIHPQDFLSWLVASGIEVRSFERALTPLEDIFIKLVQE
jgi:ABC-2 type transport system ATP-binding protein